MRRLFIDQGIPLILTVVVFVALWSLIHIEILFLNSFGIQPIRLAILWPDVLVGITIYLKTSIDFAIFIGHLMRTHPGMRSRIAIECGTALGNALGTMVVLALWNFFREIDWLLALMVIIASLVLLKLAQDGLEHAKEEEGLSRSPFARLVQATDIVLARINSLFSPLISQMIPHATLNVRHQYRFWGLLAFSCSIPFILGLDDFAGYVPLFSIIHVYGFAIGVLLGHMILNICLFLSPDVTIRLVKQPLISFVGSLAFVALALWGFYEAWHIIEHAYF